MLERTVRAATALAAVAVLAMATVSTWHTAVAPEYGQPGPLLAMHGSEPTDEVLRVSALDGDAPQRTYAIGSDGFQVVIVKVPIEALHESTSALGRNMGQYALAHPSQPGMALLAYGSKSPHLGCQVDLLDHPLVDRSTSRQSMWLIDPCHQGLWDVLGLGAQRTDAQPGASPLDIVPLRLQGDTLWMEAPIEQSQPYGASTETAFGLA